METPKDRLFVFTPEELKTLNIVTVQAEPAQAAIPAAAQPPAKAK
jgi:hypothetical protein